MNATCLVDPYTLICNEYDSVIADVEDRVSGVTAVAEDCLSGNPAVAEDCLSGTVDPR